MTLNDELKSIIENYINADGYRYKLADQYNNQISGGKCIENPQYQNYIYVYWGGTNGTIWIATSTDLLNWTNRTVLESTNGSQPSIHKTSDGGFLVAYEYNDSSTSSLIRIRYYTNYNNLLTGTYYKSKDLPRTLSSGNEGTPNFYFATLNPNIDNSTIDIGFHYNANPDKQARGTLTNFTSWSSHPDIVLNNAITAFGDNQIGDRDYFIYKNTGFIVIEANPFTNGQTDWHNWHIYLYNTSTGQTTKLNITNPENFNSVSNPDITILTGPNGGQNIYVNVNIFTDCCAWGLTFYKNTCPTASCTLTIG